MLKEVKMNKFAWYDHEKKECMPCGVLLPDEAIQLAQHETEAYHKLRTSVRHYDPTPQDLEKIQARDEYKALTEAYEKRLGTIYQAVVVLEDLKKEETERYEKAVKHLLPFVL